jgi:hypothetical protein
VQGSDTDPYDIAGQQLGNGMIPQLHIDETRSTTSNHPLGRRDAAGEADDAPIAVTAAAWRRYW